MIKILTYFIVILSLNVFAVTDYAKSVEKLGVQGDKIYFRVKEGFSTNCKWGNIYFHNNTDFGKAAFASLMAAKATGTVLSRIDYTQATDESCTLTLVEMN